MSVADLVAASPRQGSRTYLVRDDDGPNCSWAEIRDEVLRVSGRSCVRCGDTATEVDHIWPRRWGGDHFLENLQPLCGTCNRSKGASLDLETASPAQLLATFDVMWNRLITEVNSVGSPAMDQLSERVRSGEVDRAWAHSVLARFESRLEALSRSIGTMRDIYGLSIQQELFSDERGPQ